MNIIGTRIISAERYVLFSLQFSTRFDSFFIKSGNIQFAVRKNSGLVVLAYSSCLRFHIPYQWLLGHEIGVLLPTLRL